MMGRRRRRYSPAEKARARDLFAAGVNVFDAAEALGRTPQGVADLARREWLSNRWFIDLNRVSPEAKAARVRHGKEPETYQRPEVESERARVKVIDTFQNCAASMRVIAFYGQHDAIDDTHAPPGYRHLGRDVLRRIAHGGGFSRWVQ